MTAPNQPHCALVTGAASGFGAIVARALHAVGHRVVITDVDGAAAQALAMQIDPTGATAMAQALDIRRSEDYERVRDEVVRSWGSIEILVNNAAVTFARSVLEIDVAEFNAVLATNAGGFFAGCQAMGRYFKERGYGRIVNLASLAGQNGGTATGAHYAASKGAIITLTKVFARDLAPFGITVNAVAPGPMDTPLVHALVPAEKMGGLLGNIPVGQLVDPHFVAATIVLLASPSAATVTGACWDINGGLLMR